MKKINFSSKISDDTRELLNNLMIKEGFSKIQMKRIQEQMNSMRVLSPSDVDKRKLIRNNAEINVISKKRGKRSRNDMIKSGAYDNAVFKPKDLVNFEEEKIKLQNFMTFGKCKLVENENDDGREMRRDATKSPRLPMKEEWIRELQWQINERTDFLRKMKDLRADRTHYNTITQQISAKLRSLDKAKSNDIL